MKATMYVNDDESYEEKEWVLKAQSIHYYGALYYPSPPPSFPMHWFLDCAILRAVRVGAARSHALR